MQLSRDEYRRPDQLLPSGQRGKAASSTCERRDRRCRLGVRGGRALAATVDFGAYSRLLDLGGGSAAVDIELCRAFPPCGPPSSTCHTWPATGSGFRTVRLLPLDVPGANGILIASKV
jgi:hypothetical protein